MNRVRELREAAGISQAQLAKRLGTYQVVVSRWETGQCDPETYFLRLLRRELGASIDCILGEEESR